MAKNPRILIVTPEITYLPEGMGNLAGKMSAKAGGMADVSASLVQALHELGADVHSQMPGGCSPEEASRAEDGEAEVCASAGADRPPRGTRGRPAELSASWGLVEGISTLV